ncbi:MAG TPA: NfeD family protein [Thermomicrobiales bacterium]|jgi:membrane-bound serine protease (ClpP class)|nr:NfeD family protein [Thermomicrobiales bacterium]
MRPTRFRLVVRSLCLLAFAFGLLLPVAGDLARAQRQTVVPVVTLEDPVTPVRAGMVVDAIRDATDAGAPAVMLRIEVRSGSSSTTARILDAMRESPIPILTWVPPSTTVDGPGATLLLAGHVATMAPDAGLSLDGAYHHTANPFDDDTPSADRAGELRGILAAHDRPTDWVGPALATRMTLGGTDALVAGAIDATATDPAGVLAATDGRAGTLLAGATTDDVDPGWIDRLGLFLFQPTVAYLLLCLGAVGVFLELSTSGFTFAGIWGLVALVGAVLILGAMPVNWIGLVLLAGGLVLLIIDIFVRSLGLLTVGGIAGFVVGSYVLFEGDGTAGYVVAPAAIWAVTISLIVFFVFRAGSSIKGMRKRRASGREAMVGQVGLARTALAPEGMVDVDGETCRAHALTLHRSAVAPVIAAGAPVVVTRIDGLLLEVRAASKVEAEQAGHAVETDREPADRRGVVAVGGRAGE